MDLRSALASKVLLGDGANGTFLSGQGYKKTPYDLANVESPEKVLQSHKQYVAAGADFVETNTFMSNRFRLEGYGFEAARLNEMGAQLARKAVEGTNTFVLGAVGPIGRPLAPFGSVRIEDAEAAYKEQASALLRGGVDGFFLETFVDLVEIQLALGVIRGLTDKPIFASKAFLEDGEVIAQGFPAKCAEQMASWGADAIGANCIVGPQRMLDLVRMMVEATDVPIIALPTPGLPQLVKGEVSYDTSPDYFAKASARLVEEGAKVVGGCCGTTPDHISALRSQIDKGIKMRTRATATIRLGKEIALRQSDPRGFADRVGRDFLVAVELDVPRGLRQEKVVATAVELKEAGCDVVNISDGARARLRMNPTAISTLIQEKTGLDVTMHFSCRDRNLLAIQSDLLGAHALGIRSILAVTGDPANIGDYPSATSVFDVDSIGLCRILSRFNEGQDLAGYSVGAKCAFTICAAYNPGALDQEAEDSRLKQKVEAGATVIYTQPVFEKAQADRAVQACSKLGVSVFLGVLPLKNTRHAEFMHNEVPGVCVPDELRAELATASTDEDAMKIGISQACKLAQYVKNVSNGLYLMPPFGSAKISAEVICALR